VAPGAPAYEPQERQRSSADHSMSMSNDNRRPSIGFGPPPPLPHAPAYGSKFSYSSEINSQSGYQPQSQASYSSHHSHQPSYGSSDLFNSRAPPPPLEPVHPRTRPLFTTPPLSDRPFSSGRLPPINTSLNTISNKQLEPAPPSPAGPQTSYYSAVQTPSESHKRGYGQVFSDRHLYEPLKQAARPSTPGHSYQPQYYGGAEVEESGHEPLKLTYKRSDGNFIHREMPAHHQYA
jgi:hypothetical protein